MKKLLIATAAMAMVAGTAQAQSSVTIYGVLDSGITRASNANQTNTSNTGLTNGGLSTPRWGFKGAEDLGGGLKAGFVLESEYLTDTGAATATLFNRASYLNLAQAGVGSIQLGHMNRQDYSMTAKFDTFGGNNIGGWLASNKGTVDLKVGERIDNAVQLKTASFGGLVLTYQHAYGEVAGNSSASKTTAFGAEFTAGPFAAAATIAEKNDANSVGTKATSVYAKYDFKVADLRLGYAKTEVDGSTVEKSGYFVGVKVPVNKKVAVMAQYNAFDNDAGMEPTTYALGATYAFSKRTTAYLIGAKSNQDNGSAQNVVSTSKYDNFDSPLAGNNQTAYSVGIRHKF
uniref:porin n=1 Tax=Polynucleobacter sp. TaxID=2029855 RepID=UPI00404784ED